MSGWTADGERGLCVASERGGARRRVEAGRRVCCGPVASKRVTNTEKWGRETGRTHEMLCKPSSCVGSTNHSSLRLGGSPF